MTVLKRVLIPLGELLVWLIVASFVVFTLLSLLPGDVAQVILGANADPKAAATVRSRLGLDLPWPQRYWDWISSLVRGDLGTSIVSAEPIGPQIASRLAVTGWLVGLSLVLALLVCLPVGAYAAVHRRKSRGFVASALSQVLMSIPAFLAGILLILLFSVTLGWLPAGGYVPLHEDVGAWAAHLILPVLSLSIVQAAVMTRYVRSAFIDVLADDHMQTARAVGWRLWPALHRHGLRNASISLATVLGLQASAMLVGAIVVEEVFVIPGLGSYLLDAVSTRDLLVVSDVVMVIVAIVMAISYLTDLIVVVLDPRLRTTIRAAQEEHS